MGVFVDLYKFTILMYVATCDVYKDFNETFCSTKGIFNVNTHHRLRILGLGKHCFTGHS